MPGRSKRRARQPALSPSCLEPWPTSGKPTQSANQPSNVSRLSRIVANILKDFYGIRSRSTESQLKLAEVHTRSLEEWRKDIAYLLDTTGVDSSLFLPIFLRQRNVLNLAFWHAKILLYRPFLLTSFASLNNSGARSRQAANAVELATKGELCLHAAMQVVNLVDQLSLAGQLYSNFWVRNKSFTALRAS